MKKNAIKISLFIFIFSVLANPYLFASNESNQAKKCDSYPSVCLATPDSLSLYLDFQRDISSLLKSNPFETVTETISTPEWGLFTNKLLHLKDPSLLTNNLATKTLNAGGTATERIVIANITTTFLFTISAVSTLGDGIMGFMILLDDRPIVRDWKKLLDIDRDLSNRAYDLWQIGIITKTIKNTEKIQTIIEHYQNKGLILQWAQVPKSIRYTELFLELTKMNRDMKQFFAFKTKGQFGSESELLFLKFNPERIKKLKSDYDCVRFDLGLRCNQSLKNFSSSIKNLLNNSKQTGIWVGDKFIKSRERLTQALAGFKYFKSKKDESLSEYEKKMLQEQGLYTPQQHQLPIGFSKSMKAQRNDTKNKFNDHTFENKIKTLYTLTKDQENRREIIKKEAAEVKTNPTEEKIKREERIKTIEDSEKRYLENLNKNYQEQYLNQILKEGIVLLMEKELEITEKIKLEEPLALTNQFGKLAQEIKTLELIIGDQKEGLRKEIYNVCSYQCSNKSKLECYSK